MDDAEAEALIKEIAERLASLCYHNKKVVEMVKTRDEAYSGPETVHGPDLVAVPHHGFDLKGSPQAKEVFGKSDLAGAASQMVGPQLKNDLNLSVAD